MSKSKINDLQIDKNKIKKLSKKLLNPKYKYEKKKIFEHWQKIPVIKEIPENMPSNLIQQEVRSAILDIGRNGMEEYDDSDDRVLMRHVFSANELNRLINEKLNKKVKISNVYFHLNTLKEKNFIEIVTSIKEGRQTTHFYGRTARLFLWMGEAQNTKNLDEDSIYPHFSSLLRNFNPSLSQHEIQTLYKSLLLSNKASHERIKLWMEKNVETLTKINFDTRLIYKLLKSIDIGNSNEIETNKKIALLLQLSS